MQPIRIQSEQAGPDSERMVVAAETYAEAVVLNGFLAEGFRVLQRRAELPGGLTNDEIAARRQAFDATPTFTPESEVLPTYELSDAKIAYAGASSYVRKAASRLVRRGYLSEPRALEAQRRRQRISRQLGEIIRASAEKVADDETGSPAGSNHSAN